MQKTHPKEKSFHYHSSRFKFFWAYIAFVVLLASGTATYRLGYSPSIYLSLIALAILDLVIGEIRIRSDKIVLKDESITISSGLLSGITRKINYHNISEIDVRQSLFQRPFGYGDMEIVVLGSHVQQNISHHFSGKGDVRLEAPDTKARGIILKKFQKVKEIESVILSRIKEHPKAYTHLHK